MTPSLPQSVTQARSRSWLASTPKIRWGRGPKSGACLSLTTYLKSSVKASAKCKCLSDYLPKHDRKQNVNFFVDASSCERINDGSKAASVGAGRLVSDCR